MNPGYDEVLGHRCYPSVAEVPGPPDLAILGVANHRIEGALAEAIAAGSRSAVTFSSLHEADPDPDRPPLFERVAALAREAGIPLCGGNGMGFLNEEAHLRATGFDTPDVLRPGPVTFISHSGSAFAAFAFSDRGIGFNLLVSSGQEIVTTMADYMEYALGLSSTRVLALLLETVRGPDRFRAQLDARRRLRHPGAGAEGRSHRRVQGHGHGPFGGARGRARRVRGAVRRLWRARGPLARRDGRRHGAVRVPQARHDGGGHRHASTTPAASAPCWRTSPRTLGCRSLRSPMHTRAELADTLDPGLEAANPLDAWGTGIDADRIFRDAFLALHDDPDTAALAFVVDLTRQGQPYDEGYLAVALDVAAATTKPFCVLSNLASAVAPEEGRYLREAGIPVLEGTASGLKALGHLMRYRDLSARPSLVVPDAVSSDVRSRWGARLESGSMLTELEGLALLADYGVPVVRAQAASSADDAVAVADALGYPVVLKTAAPGVHHKSEVGGVRVSLADRDEVREAYDDLAARLGPDVIVAPDGQRGASSSPSGSCATPSSARWSSSRPAASWWSCCMIGASALPPLDERRARELVHGLSARPLLEGLRGAAPADVGALASAIVRLSVLAADLGDRLDALDVNPLIVSPVGCAAVDVLVLPRS